MARPIRKVQVFTGDCKVSTFHIDEQARQTWLAGFDRILHQSNRYSFPAEHIAEFRDWLRIFSEWMVNQVSLDSSTKIDIVQA